jgi:ribosome-binding protein aMBF1 (putative translation factor)
MHIRSMATRNDLKKLATAITERRQAAGLRQNALAKRVKLSSQTLNNYERARFWPSLKAWIDLDREIGVGRPWGES